MACSSIVPKKGFNCESVVTSNIQTLPDGSYKLYLKRKNALYFKNYLGVKVQINLNEGKLPVAFLKKLKYGDVLNFSFK